MCIVVLQHFADGGGICVVEGCMSAHVGFYRLDGAWVYCFCGDLHTRILTLYKDRPLCMWVSVGMIYLCLVWLVMASVCLYALLLLRVRFHC